MKTETNSKKRQVREVGSGLPLDDDLLAFVFLGEHFTPKSFIGCVLIGIGTLVMVL